MGGMLTLVLFAGVFVGFGAFVVLAYRRRWQWTGLPARAAPDNKAGEWRAKTLWDWLQLLGIPVVLVALAFLLNEAQSSRELQREDQRAAQQRRTAEDAERENTLRTYLAQMSDLMLHGGLLRSQSGADVRTVARTATLTAVRRLDGTRRGLVIRFLFEARLLRRRRAASAAVVVALADFSQAYLRGANLREADLRLANLRRANLSQAYLGGADLRLTDLGGADLRDAFLGGADLRGASLRGADLRGAILFDANLLGADLRGSRDVDTTGSTGKPDHGP
jgi:hypothetical protein